MHYYHIGYRDLLSIPLPAFWALSEQTHSLKAQDDIELINAVYTAVWGGEYAEKLQSVVDDGNDDAIDHIKLNELKQKIMHI